MKFSILNSMALICLVILFQIAICFNIFANPYVKGYHPDEYELDDTPENASEFRLSTVSPQIHNFHKQGDEDWIKFHALKSDETYEIKTFNPGENCETVIILFDQDGMTKIKESIFTSTGSGGITPGVNLLSWAPDEDGIYYVRFIQKDTDGDGPKPVFGDDTSYRLWIYRPVMPETGYIEGFVTNAESGNPVGGAVVQTNHSSGVSSFTSYGYYTIQCLVGDFTVTARKTGYESFSKLVTVGEASRVELYIALTPSYSYNSTYEVIQWLKRGSDTYYCIDICDLSGNAYPGLENLVCAEDMNAWSPKQYININLGIPDSALSGFQFMWKIRSSSGYGGEGFEGSM